MDDQGADAHFGTCLETEEDTGQLLTLHLILALQFSVAAHTPANYLPRKPPPGIPGDTRKTR